MKHCSHWQSQIAQLSRCKSSGVWCPTVVREGWGSSGVGLDTRLVDWEFGTPWVAPVLDVANVSRVGIWWVPSVDRWHHAWLSFRWDLNLTLTLEWFRITIANICTVNRCSLNNTFFSGYSVFITYFMKTRECKNQADEKMNKMKKKGSTFDNKDTDIRVEILKFHILIICLQK